MTQLEKEQGQKRIIMQHLIRNQTITSYEAFKEYGIMRLSSIIFRLIHEGGQNIVGYWVQDGDRRFYEYRIKDIRGIR